jgi:hypothetical protein
VVLEGRESGDHCHPVSNPVGNCARVKTDHRPNLEGWDAISNYLAEENRYQAFMDGIVVNAVPEVEAFRNELLKRLGQRAKSFSIPTATSNPTLLKKYLMASGGALSQWADQLSPISPNTPSR